MRYARHQLKAFLLRNGYRYTETTAWSQAHLRYLRHVLPRGLRSIRYYGFCHPSAKKTRLKVTALSGRRTEPAPPKAAAQELKCPRCQQPMELWRTIRPLWLPAAAMPARGPPAVGPIICSRA